jgi:thiaminase/transcriptional activator TenA
VVATVGELGWFEEMAARRGLALDAAKHPTTRAYCDFLLAVTYSGYPAQITAIWALERSYLESWDSARPGAHPYREFVKRWNHRRVPVLRRRPPEFRRSPAQGLHRRTGPRS